MYRQIITFYVVKSASVTPLIVINPIVIRNKVFIGFFWLLYVLVTCYNTRGQYATDEEKTALIVKEFEAMPEMSQLTCLQQMQKQIQTQMQKRMQKQMQKQMRSKYRSKCRSKCRSK